VVPNRRICIRATVLGLVIGHVLGGAVAPMLAACMSSGDSHFATQATAGLGFRLTTVQRPKRWSFKSSICMTMNMACLAERVQAWPTKG
jgi:hypothetical protein